MVAVHVSVAEAVHEVSRLEPADLRQHAGEERVGCDIEWNAEAHVARPLVHLAAELAVSHVELGADPKAGTRAGERRGAESEMRKSREERREAAAQTCC